MFIRYIGVLLSCFYIFFVAGCIGNSSDIARPQVLSAEDLAIIESQNVIPSQGEVSGLYVRRTPSDTGYFSNYQATVAQSPDIIPSGSSLIADPLGAFGTPNSYGEGFGDASISVAQNNYIYVRAKNFAAFPADANVYLYYAPAGLFLTPDQWKDNLIRTKSGADHATLSTSSTGAIAVTGDPFSFIPLPSSYPFSLIARLTPVDQPSPIPNIFATNDYLQWVPGSGTTYRTIVPVKIAGSVSQPFRIANPDPADRQFLFVLKNAGLPPGTVVSFCTSSGTPCLQRTTITDSTFMIGVIATLAAGHQSTLYVTIWPGETAIQPGAKLSISQQTADYDSSRARLPKRVYMIGEASIVFY
jgi:hypothetical protein